METIFSLVTKPIHQNIAVIRISGPETFSIVKKWFQTAANTKPDLTPNTARYYHFYGLDKKYIDEGLMLVFKAPNSFTGEDVVEVQVHGSMFVVQKLVSLISKLGARQSLNGEFMQQAFINGKIDLTQSEAINQLILTDNKQLALLASENVKGKESQVIKKLVAQLEDVLARIQVGIDYPENTDLPEYNLDNIQKNLKVWADKLEAIIQDSQRLINISAGIKVAFVGAPNVGKSTLLNALLKKERAIVSEEAGTTRDVIESELYLKGVKVTLQDTAGIRQTTNSIEQEGIRRSKEIINHADICVVLIDGSSNVNKQLNELNFIPELNKNVIYVLTKNDLKKASGLPKDIKFIPISAKEGKIESLLKALENNLQYNYFDEKKNKNNLLISQNQVDKFKLVQANLRNALGLIYQSHNLDLIVFEIEDAITNLNNLLGKTKDLNYLNNLFTHFCLGK